MRLLILAAAIGTVLLSGCGGGGGGASSSTTTSTSSNAPSSITSDGASCADGGALSISGTINYQKPAFSATLGSGLDYNNIQTNPVRGAEIQALGSDGCVISSSTTSNTGTYTLNVDPSKSVRIRVKARLVNTGGPSWDFEVRDNTSSNGLYVLDGSLATSGTANSTRNLTATTGWGGSSYTSTRSSAPFAILDTIYSSVLTVLNVDATVNMDDADIFWSVNNSTADGTLSAGEIGGSFYSNDQIYILGRENSDTDEFDSHVVAHEWGHYLEDNLSRGDSIGGTHSVSDLLDLRVAFSEGFSNAFSAIVLNDSVYRDSSGNQQGGDFQINVESNATGTVGWFNQGSVHTIVYDIFDTVSDANDSVSLGFSAIYNAMTNATYKAQSSLISIFSFINQLKADNPGSSANIDILVNSQSIATVIDNYGTNETNNGGNANDLPVYKILADDNNPVTVCSNKTNGEYNKLGNGQLMRLNVASGGSHTITVTRVSGAATSNPNFVVYLNGSSVLLGTSSTNNSETVVGNLNVDEYIMDVYDAFNVDNNSSTGGNVCFNVTVS